ncbi:hypothetical protein EG68_12261 [Paragonimus skrjabini miyazakii]|uniref:DUF4806 domain-containing protein n=1 Tax=Paragonimus skrjabini miyazakii TaxID=59628 RepID=A0A8S9YGF0_9TREM|nr:hypothetical protein EG68_12261 [Paragonimus skrjabini miyazakii]
MFLNELCYCVNVQMNALRATVERLTSEIARLADKHAPSLALPRTSVKQLQEVDSKMLGSKFHSAMADYFRGISASSAGALLRSMLERVMTRAVASQITYSGTRQTFAFKRTQLSFLLGQVHERTEYATIQVSMLNECCKGWLHCARDKRYTPNSCAPEIGDGSQENIRIVDLDEQKASDLDAAHLFPILVCF